MKKKENKIKKEKGITLIALVVTIIILLILAGVAIGTITGDNGLFKRASETKELHEISEEKEAITLAMSSLKIEKTRESVFSNLPETLVTPEELKAEMDNGFPKPISVGAGDGEGILKVTFDEKRKNRSYDVTQQGEITEKKVLTPEEAKQVIDVVFSIPVMEYGVASTPYVLTGGGQVIETTISSGNIFSTGEISENVITTNGVRKKVDNCFIDNKGKVYTWGSNRNGALGAGKETDEYSNVPICISDKDGSVLNGKNIVDICQFKNYNAFIARDDKGRVYTWGVNDKGILGAGISDTSYESYSNVPICISDQNENALNGKVIVDVRALDSSIIALDSNGKVYTWGSNNGGILGAGISDTSYESCSNVPICISDKEGSQLKDRRIVDIIYTYNILIAKDDKGRVYTWGGNKKGGLGAEISDTSYESCSNVPICISDQNGNALNGKVIVDVRVLGSSIIALDSNGKVYTWGSNNGGILGAGISDTSYESCSNVPICISDQNGNPLKGRVIVDIFCVGIVKDIDGKLYTWGSNYEGGLGAGISDTSYESCSNVPICISDQNGNALNGKVIVDVRVLGSSIIALDSDGKVYTWGSNRDGALGAGKETDEYSNVPICISDIVGSPLNGRKIVEITSIKNENPIIVKDSEGNVYVWGPNGKGQLCIGVEDSYSNVPICVNEVQNSELSGKKIRKVITEDCRINYITEDNEIYIYYWRATPV